MGEEKLKLEFRGKSNSRRRRIFRERARAVIRPLAVSFYEKNEISASPAAIDAVTDAVVEDIISIVRKKPGFTTEVLEPELAKQEALYRKMYEELQRTVSAEKPFAFIRAAKHAEKSEA